MKTRQLILLIAVLVVGWSSVGFAADTRKKEPVKKAPARIHFSSNFQGELEPCG